MKQKLFIMPHKKNQNSKSRKQTSIMRLFRRRDNKDTPHSPSSSSQHNNNNTSIKTQNNNNNDNNKSNQVNLNNTNNNEINNTNNTINNNFNDNSNNNNSDISPIPTRQKKKNPLRILTPKKFKRRKTSTTTNSSGTNKSPATPLDHHHIDVNELYESHERVVANKVKQSRIYGKRFEEDEEGLYIFSRNLSSKESLLNSYLTTRWVQTVELMKNVEKEVNVKKNRNNSIFSSQPESTAASGTENVKSIPSSDAPHASQHENKDIDTDDMDDIDDLFGKDTNDMSPDQVEQLMKAQQSELKNHMKVKLVITEINNTQFSRSIRKAISPILSQFEVFPEMGMFHSALVVGPWYLEWNNSSLVVPRQCISRAAIISADINTIKTIGDIHSTAEKLADVVVKWNTSMKYTNRSGSFESGTGNCQDFVEDVLDNLGLETSFKGALGRFISQLRKKGKCDMEFDMDPHFRETFSLHQQSVVFNNHVEIDNFVNDLVAKDPMFERNYPNEWALLKSFDRAFWLRHFRYPQKEKYKPLLNDEDDDVFDQDSFDSADFGEPAWGCPFGNPEITSHWHGT